MLSALPIRLVFHFSCPIANCGNELTVCFFKQFFLWTQALIYYQIYPPASLYFSPQRASSYYQIFLYITGPPVNISFILLYTIYIPKLCTFPPQVFTASLLSLYSLAFFESLSQLLIHSHWVLNHLPKSHNGFFLDQNQFYQVTLIRTQKFGKGVKTK